MMTFLLFAQAAAAPALPPLPMPETEPSAAVSEEIVVIGEAMKTWKGGVYKKDGQLACRIRKSSGDEAIDTIRCGAMLRCYAPIVPQLDAIAAMDLSREERSRRMQPVVETTVPCVEQASEAGIRMLAELRAG